MYFFLKFLFIVFKKKIVFLLFYEVYFHNRVTMIVFSNLKGHCPN
jgi:hypothetical protein